MFKSPTCGPSGVERRTIWPAGTVQALAERMGIMNDSMSVRAAFAMAE